MKKGYGILLLVFGFSTLAFSQDYKTGFGFRGGLGNGITVKHFISSDKAIEGIKANWTAIEVYGAIELKHKTFRFKSHAN